MSGSNASALARAGNELKTLGSDPVRWLFLLGNRILVAAVLFGAFLGLFCALYWSGRVAFRNQTALLYLLSSLVGGNLTLVTLVISINQVIISRQLSSPGELREQIRNVTEYRQDVLDPENQSVVPVTPSDFLEAILQDTRRELQRLGGMTAGSADEAVREDVDDVVTELTEHIDRVTGLIEKSGSGTFETLSATLTTNYAQHIYQIRQIKGRHRDGLSDEANEALENVVTRLQEIDVARQYFKTLYTQTELSYISRTLLYAGVVAEAVLVSALLTLTASRGAPPGVPTVAIPIVAGVGLLPLSVLFAFVLRLATVTQRTAAITPFTTPEQEESPV